MKKINNNMGKQRGDRLESKLLGLKVISVFLFVILMLGVVAAGKFDMYYDYNKDRVVVGSDINGLETNSFVDSDNNNYFIDPANVDLSGLFAGNIGAKKYCDENGENCKSLSDIMDGGKWNESATAFYPKDLSKNVGIGTSSPGAKLHINAGNSAFAAVFEKGSSSATMELRETSNQGYAAIDFMNQGVKRATFGSSSVGAGVLPGDFWISARANNKLHLASGTTPVLTVDNSKNVGIGTANPKAKFDVYGDARFGVDGKLSISSVSAGGCPGCGTESVGLQTTIDERTVEDGLPYATENRHVLALQPDFGYVGVGTASPTQKLDVNGNINVADGSAYMYGGVQALKLSKGISSTTYTNTYVGAIAGSNTAEQTAVGYTAGYQNTGDQQTAIGVQAGRQNTGDQQTAIGYLAGKSNTGGHQSAFGLYAGTLNEGGQQTAFGEFSGYRNTGVSQLAFGHYAGRQNTGAYQTAIGSLAGWLNTGDRVSSFGYESARDNTGNDVVAVGYQAGKGNTESNKFIVQQSNVNSVPLIKGDFATGDVNIAGSVNAGKFVGDGSGLTNLSLDSMDLSGYYNKTETDGKFIAKVDEQMLNVNGSDYWDDLDSVSDIKGSRIDNDMNWINSTKLSEFENDLGIGNWTGDKSGYYTKDEVDGEIVILNDSLKNYTDTKFVTKDEVGSLEVNDSTHLGGYNPEYFMPLNKSVYGNFDFNKGWTDGGVSIVDGNIYAQTGYFYKVNSIDIARLSINGSIVPPTGYDNQFDIGKPGERWNDGNFGGTVTADKFVGDGSGLVNLPASAVDLSGYYNKSEVYTKGETDNKIIEANTSMKDYVDSSLSEGLNDSKTWEKNGDNIYYNKGDVGIGTMNPTSKLHAYLQGSGSVATMQASGDVGYIQFKEGGTTRGFVGYGNSGALFTGAAENSFAVRAEGDLHLGSNGNNLAMTVKDGKVGVGTTNPQAKLQVNDNYHPISGLSPFAIMGENKNDIETLHLENANTGTAAEVRFVAKADNSDYMAFSQPSSQKTGSFFGQLKKDSSYLFAVGRDLVMGTITSDDIVFGTGNSEKMRITPLGKVGIGTNDPKGKLEVVNGQGSIIFSDSSSTIDFTRPGANYLRATGTNGAFMFVNGDSYNSEDISMSISANGRVGIGAISPSEKLEVVGNIKADKFIGDGSGLTNISSDAVDLSDYYDREEVDSLGNWTEDKPDYVPYTGADKDLNMGEKNVVIGGATFSSDSNGNVVVF